MTRYLLIHEGQRIPLAEGETLLGRGLGCRIRFNDPAVSREHLRIEVTGAGARARNLSSNGTLHNGSRLIEPTELRVGDELQIGFRRLQLEVSEQDVAPAPPVPSRARAPAGDFAEEDTDPGEEDAWRRRRDLKALAALQEDHEPSSRTTQDVPRREVFTPRTLEAIKTHTCPRCQRVVSFFDDQCPSCAYAWPPGHPSKRTQKIVMENVKQRAEPRFTVEVPVIYSSETLTIDAIVRDISRGGMFIESELLDPVGTRCEVTALPDGHSALRFSGMVVHVSDDMSRSAETGVSGLGIRFISGSGEAMGWLEWILARHGRAVVE